MSATINSSILDNEQVLSIWGDILKDSIPHFDKKDGEITAKEFAELLGIREETARKRLKALENKGLVSKRWYMDSKRKRILLYLPISK
jgi:predicted HTH transcriptional regulator